MTRKKDLKSKIKKLPGWAIKGRPFSPEEFKKSHLKTSLKSKYKMDYGDYLQEFSRQYKDTKLRKNLIGTARKKQVKKAVKEITKGDPTKGNFGSWIMSQ